MNCGVRLQKRGRSLRQLNHCMDIDADSRLAILDDAEQVDVRSLDPKKRAATAAANEARTPARP